MHVSGLPSFLKGELELGQQKNNNYNSIRGRVDVCNMHGSQHRSSIYLCRMRPATDLLLTIDSLARGCYRDAHEAEGFHPLPDSSRGTDTGVYECVPDPGITLNERDLILLSPVPCRSRSGSRGLGSGALNPVD